MRICGVDLKGSEARLAIIEKNASGSDFVPCAVRKITLGDDKIAGNLRDFQKSLDVFLMENKIDKIALRQRARKGSMAGGAISFKMEAIVQLQDNCRVEFISPVAVASFKKKYGSTKPDDVFVYQDDAYFCALTLASKLQI